MKKFEQYLLESVSDLQLDIFADDLIDLENGVKKAIYISDDPQEEKDYFVGLILKNNKKSKIQQVQCTDISVEITFKES